MRSGRGERRERERGGGDKQILGGWYCTLSQKSKPRMVVAKLQKTALYLAAIFKSRLGTYLSFPSLRPCIVLHSKYAHKYCVDIKYVVKHS